MFSASSSSMSYSVSASSALASVKVTMKIARLQRRITRLSDRDLSTLSSLLDTRSKMRNGYEIDHTPLCDRHEKPKQVDIIDGMVVCTFVYQGMRTKVWGRSVKENVKAWASFLRLLSRSTSIAETVYIHNHVVRNLIDPDITFQVDAGYVRFVLSDRVRILVNDSWNADGYYGIAYNG